ncbi:MAG: hypothetical protein CW342_01825 [Thermoactinomycetaceae bacterium]|nr:hypothetical protein [Thermoactinomycetaceae bacterium]
MTNREKIAAKRGSKKNMARIKISTIHTLLHLLYRMDLTGCEIEKGGNPCPGLLLLSGFTV